MRILHFALSPRTQPALVRALRSLAGTDGDYLEIDWMASKSARTGLSRAFSSFKPDLTFCQVQAPGVVGPRDFVAATGLVFNWTGDVRRPLPRWYVDVGRVVSSTLFCNETDVEQARACGIRSSYLNIGFDERIYCPGIDEAHEADIVFFGNDWKRQRFPLSGQRREMVRILATRYGSRFKVYGKGWGWGTHPCHDGSIEASIYRGCKIAINQNHFNHDRFSSDRLLRAMGCGAYVVSNHYPNIEKDFIPGKHLGAWKTFEDLFREIDWALEHEEERKAIAAAGCALVHEKHTWSSRMTELMVIADEIKRTR